MPRLWLLFGIVYIIIAAAIFLDHTFRLEAEWRWNEAMHHEAFFITVIWVAAACLFVSLAEYIRGKRRERKYTSPVFALKTGFG